MTSLSHLRNFGILAHVDAGKTTVGERMLFLTGRIHRVGEVHHGTTHLDFEPEERTHGITISAAATSLDWTPLAGLRAGQPHELSLIDTPGHVDFTAEVERSVRVLDGAVVVLDATQGVEPQTESVWRRADRYGVARLVFVNKMDVVGASFQRCLDELRSRLAAEPVAIQLPIGAERELRGVIDLLTLEACEFAGAAVRRRPLPAAHAAAALAAREALVESLAAVDDQVLRELVESGAAAVSAASLERALRVATLARLRVPVLCGAALRDLGIQPLLDAVAAYLPSPVDVPAAVGRHPATGEAFVCRADGPPYALVFKCVTDEHVGTLCWVRVYGGALRAGDQLALARTGQRERVGRCLTLRADRTVQVDELGTGRLGAVLGPKHARTGDTLCSPGAPLALEAMRFPAPIVELAIEPAGRDELARLAAALAQAQAEDPTLQVRTDPETGQTLLCGVGELQLQIHVERLRGRHGLTVRTGAPKVALRATPQAAARVRYRHVRQSGGPGQFAVVELALRPLERGEGVRVVDATRGGAVPRELAAAVEKGVLGALSRGRDGAPVVDVEVTLLDGETHVKDSSPMAFELAGSLAVQQALEQAGTVVLEPVMRLEVAAPEAFLGGVLGEIAARRGSVAQVEARGPGSLVVAHVALRRVFGFVDALRGRTEGRGEVTMQLHGYEAVK